MEEETALKRRFLILTIFCMAPTLLFFVTGFALGLWQELPIIGTLAFLLLIGSIVAVLLAYYFLKDNIFLR